MGIAKPHRGPVAQAGTGQPPVAGLDHGGGQFNAQVLAARRLQQLGREGRIAGADLRMRSPALTASSPIAARLSAPLLRFIESATANAASP